MVIEAVKENKIGAGTGKTRVFKAMAEDSKEKTSPTQLLLNTSSEIPNAKCKASKRWSINEAFAFERDVNKSSRYSSS